MVSCFRPSLTKSLHSWIRQLTATLVAYVAGVSKKDIDRTKSGRAGAFYSHLRRAPSPACLLSRLFDLFP